MPLCQKKDRTSFTAYQKHFRNCTCYHIVKKSFNDQLQQCLSHNWKNQYLLASHQIANSCQKKIRKNLSRQCFYVNIATKQHHISNIIIDLQHVLAIWLCTATNVCTTGWFVVSALLISNLNPQLCVFKNVTDIMS